MSIPKEPDKAKLVISLFMNNKNIFESVLSELERLFGETDIISDWFNFDFTDYYYGEMGSPLFRKVAVFKELIHQIDLAEIKEKTNILEKRWAINEETGIKRALNIDPGYLLLSRFILATGKDYSHRIYIGRGIYADLTLIYKKGGFKSLEWTYPDYASKEICGFLEQVRTKYSDDLKQSKQPQIINDKMMNHKA
ncbi:MAG: DUF4416 family protein [Desulfamplus sp.]|nr:DUF4416 family protein [Desulfamplus sp.]